MTRVGKGWNILRGFWERVSPSLCLDSPPASLPLLSSGESNGRESGVFLVRVSQEADSDVIEGISIEPVWTSDN